jgi:cysteinyl-tRNA synthetase
MLRTHYRSPIDWTVAGLRESQTVLDRWRRTVSDSEVGPDYTDAEFRSALLDDLNTPKAIARLHELYAMIKGPSSGLPQLELQRKLKASANLIGLIEAPFETWHGQLIARQTRFELTWDESLKSLIATKVSERTAARARKDFKESDRIRDELAAMGIVLKDGKDADGNPVTTWEIAR